MTHNARIQVNTHFSMCSWWAFEHYGGRKSDGDGVAPKGFVASLSQAVLQVAARAERQNLTRYPRG